MSNTTRDYRQDFDYRMFKHTASASQFDTFLLCPRKWWFQKIARLPELQGQRKFEFGDRLHEACERWLAADDQGRDPQTGAPVDLWPDGWDEGLSSFDGSLVKRLVEKGIDEGLLRRTPNRRIEAPVGRWNDRKRKYEPRQIVPGVGVCGYRDVSAPGLVEDHKSVKTRTYAKSQADLLADPQLLLYAAIDMIEHAERGLPIPDSVTLRHNQFIKNPKDLFVRPVEVPVDRATVEGFWEQHLEPAAREMLRYKTGSKDEKKWASVEGPRKKGACKTYGGCAFARICGNIEKPADYRARIERANSSAGEEPSPTNQETNMGIFDRLTTSAPATVPPEPNAPAETQAETSATPATETEVAVETPPWASPECPACAGVGFNKKAAPCAACDRRAAKEGLPRVLAFDVETDGDGFTSWVRKADGVLMGRVRLQAAEVKSGEATKPVTQATQDKGKAKRGAFDRKPAQKAAQEPPAAPVPEQPQPENVQEPVPEAPLPADLQAPTDEPKAATPTTVPVKQADTVEGKKRGRPTAGFTMVYGAVRRVRMKLLDGNELFQHHAQAVAEAHGAKSFYDLDRFKRRDWLAAKAKEISETIPSATLLLVRADDPDLRAFAAALEPFASNVIEGIS